MIINNPNFSSGEDKEMITIFGDLVLTQKYVPNPFSEQLKNGIQKSDLSIVNLEAPIKDGKPARKDGPNLETSEQTGKILSEAGFDIACLANNHIMDFGESGLLKTETEMNKHGIMTVGVGEDSESAIEPRVIELNRAKIAVYNVCAHEYGVATANNAGTAWVNEPGLIRNIINKKSEVDIIIVIVHGGNENVPIPSIQWQSRLREFSKAGADVVVGHHPHVPQGWEMFDNSPIFYSLGNFVFDQNRYSANRWGYGVELIINQNELEKSNVFLHELVGNTVRNVQNKKERESHSSYLKKCSEIIFGLQQNSGYWQEVACRKYSDYKIFYQSLGVGNLVSFYKSPVQEITLVLESIKTQYPADIPDKKKVKLLNYLRAEHHRDVPTTVLEMKIGNTEDKRNTEIINSIEKLYKYMSDGRNEENNI